MYFGKIKFFDFRVNNFGFIHEIVGDEDPISGEVYLNGDDVNCSTRELLENTKVVFEIVRERKVRAVKLRLFSSLDFSEKISYAVLFESGEFHHFIYREILNSPSTIKSEKDRISTKIFSEKFHTKPITSFEILGLLEDQSFIDNFFERIKELTDNEKLNLMGVDTEHLTKLAQIWNFDTEQGTLSLIDRIKSSKKNQNISSDFKEKFFEKCNRYKFETVLKFCGIFSEFAYINNCMANNFNYVIDNFDFIISQIEKYQNFDEAKSTYDSIKQILLKREWPLQTKQSFGFLKIFEKYNETESCKEILRLIVKLFDIREGDLFLGLVASISKHSLLDSYSMTLTEKYETIKYSFSDSQRLELMDFITGEFLKSVIDTWEGNQNYCNERLLQKAIENDKFQHLEKEISILAIIFLRSFVKSSLNNGLNSSVYFKYIKYYSKSDVLSFLIVNVLFTNEKLLLENLTKLSDESILKLLNNELQKNIENDSTDYIKILFFLLFEDYFPEIIIFQRVIRNAQGFIQSLIMKRAFYLLWRGKLDRPNFKALYNLDDWTDINIVLIKQFFNVKPKSRNEALKLLADIFREQLFKLNKQVNLNESFESLMNVRGLVKPCNGRKFYNYQLWQKDNLSRKYIISDEIDIQSPMNKCCEGRYWKNETLYYSGTKNSKVVKLYWCRGGTCSGLNSTSDTSMEYYNWTIIEIAKSVEIEIDELIQSTIGGWANRMNEITERLRCLKCNSILRPMPFDPKLLGHYATPLFMCLNVDCSEVNEIIRFTHCLNGKCEKILDSRELKTCSNGWLICTCGTCCPQHSGKEYEPKYVQDN